MIWFSWSVAEKGYEVRAGNLIAKSPPQVKAIVGLKDDFAENICLRFVELDNVSDKIVLGILQAYDEEQESHEEDLLQQGHDLRRDSRVAALRGRQGGSKF